MSFIAWGQDINVINNITVMKAVNLSINENQVTFMVPEKGFIQSPYYVNDRNLAVYCVNGSFNALLLDFDVYLNSGEYGKLEYRVDDGEVKEIQAFQNDKMVMIADHALANTIAFSGTNLAVRATAYNGDKDTAEFNLTNLKPVMNQVGCSLP